MAEVREAVEFGEAREDNFSRNVCKQKILLNWLNTLAMKHLREMMVARPIP